MKKFTVLLTAPGLNVPQELISTDDFAAAQKAMLNQAEEWKSWVDATPEGQKRSLRVRDDIDALFNQEDEFGKHSAYCWIHREEEFQGSTKADWFGEPKHHIIPC